MASSLFNLVVDCSNAWDLAQFWSAVLDRPVHPDNEPADDEVGIAIDGFGGELLFVRVPEPKSVKNRLHLCLRPHDRTCDEEVERLLGVGARMQHDLRKPNGTGWAVLTDPEGNEFCVLHNLAERVEVDA